jgi:hypothetical protein
MNAKPPSKLHPRLMGPFRVANVQGDKYACQNLVTDEIKDYHVTRLRAFHYDERFVDPRDIALRDVEEFFVEQILAHSGDVNKLKSLEFHVKWLGFDESHNSWEPWKNLRETEKLHRYLISKGLHKLIPEKFRDNYSELSTANKRRRRQEVGANNEQTVSMVRPSVSLVSPGLQDTGKSSETSVLGRVQFRESIASYWDI